MQLDPSPTPSLMDTYCMCQFCHKIVFRHLCVRVRGGWGWGVEVGVGIRR